MRCNIPEGVEVKISADLIKPLVVGHTIGLIDFPKTSRYHKEEPEELKNFLKVDVECRYPMAQIQNVQTKGKFMYWTFLYEWYMYSTFGMTGQWSPQPGKHVCMHMQLVDNKTGKLSDIYFNDSRHFGTIKFVQGKRKLNEKLNELGWDPLQRDIQEYDAFIHSHLKVSKKPIGDVLMDQKLFAGIGNYIRAESLYLCKLSPWRPANSLTSDEIDCLQQSLVDVMKESYQHQGATILTYKDAYGAEGKYSSCFKVYGQKTDPLGNKIKKETMPDGRTIHWSPAVQV